MEQEREIVSNNQFDANVIDAAARFSAAASLARADHIRRSVTAIITPEAPRARRIAAAVNRLFGL
jgi:hypothetical protein